VYAASSVDEAPKGVGCGEGVSPYPRGGLCRFFLLLSQTASFGAFWVVFSQLSCLFAAYGKLKNWDALIRLLHSVVLAGTD